MTRDEIEEKYGWQEGEREALQADQAERAERERQIRSAENLEWAKERAAARAEAERSAAAKPEPNKMPTADTTQIWETWVKNQIRTSLEREQRIMTGVIADVVGPMKQNADKANDQIAALREEVTKLQIALAEVVGEMRGRGAAEAERQARTPLKAIGTALRA